MAGEPFASDPYVVGKNSPAAEAARIPAEEALCPVMSHVWVNDEYKHLVVAASAKALAVNPASSSICCAHRPMPANCGCAGRKASIASTDARGRIEFLYKCVGRGTRGLATLKPGDELNMVGPLGIGFHLDPAWRHIVVLGRGVGLATLAPISQLAAKTASASPRSCRRAIRTS